MIGWSLNLISKFLAIRLESLFFKIIPKDMLVLFRSRNWKTTAFGGLGEPPACSLTTESVQFRQISGRYKGHATTENVSTGR
jgi:hypothetical protein